MSRQDLKRLLVCRPSSTEVQSQISCNPFPKNNEVMLLVQRTTCQKMLMRSSIFSRSSFRLVVRGGLLQQTAASSGLRKMGGHFVVQSLLSSSSNRCVMSHIHVLHLMTSSSQLVWTEKPTGHADCPPEIDRAHAIEVAMNEKAGTRDLDDEDIIDTEALDTSDDENLPPTPFPIPLP